MTKINYDSETSEQVIKLVLKDEKLANQIAKELGIGPNTVGRWVNECRKEHNLPSYREERRNRTMLSENRMAPSMSALDCPYNNACMENFFASLKKERIYRRDFKDIGDVREAVFRYIELFYNRKRLHSSLGYMTPVECRLSKQVA